MNSLVDHNACTCVSNRLAVRFITVDRDVCQPSLTEHADKKHSKTMEQCFPGLAK